MGKHRERAGDEERNERKRAAKGVDQARLAGGRGQQCFHENGDGRTEDARRVGGGAVREEKPVEIRGGFGEQSGELAGDNGPGAEAVRPRKFCKRDGQARHDGFRASANRGNQADEREGVAAVECSQQSPDGGRFGAGGRHA